MSLKNAGQLLGTHPRLGAFALFYAAKVDYDVWVDSGARSMEAQAELYSQGRDASGNVTGSVATDAKPGQSPHNYGLAIDIGPYAPERTDNLATADDPRYQELGELAKAFGLTWGGDFTLADGSHDVDHVQLPDWQQQLDWKRNITVVATLVLFFVAFLFAGVGHAG